MPSKKGSESSICLEKDGNISFDSKINAGIFKDFYSNLASDLVNQPDGPFGFSHVHESQITNILEKFDTNKAAGIFLKDGAKILSKPVTDLINLSI